MKFSVFFTNIFILIHNINGQSDTSTNTPPCIADNYDGCVQFCNNDASLNIETCLQGCCDAYQVHCLGCYVDEEKDNCLSKHCTP